MIDKMYATRIMDNRSTAYVCQYSYIMFHSVNVLMITPFKVSFVSAYNPNAILWKKQAAASMSWPIYQYGVCICCIPHRKFHGCIILYMCGDIYES
jgi:hypothetical protein